MNKKIIIFATDQDSRWEHEEKGSYDVASLENEYRSRLYTDKGKALVEKSENRSKSVNGKKNED